MRESPMTIWTIGHSTRSADEFAAALQSQRIEAVADVRKMPGSRRFPHFDQDALASFLRKKAVAYHHFPDLGGRRKPDPESRNSAWRHPAFRAYSDYMRTGEFANSLDRLLQLAREMRTAIMCAEAVWWRCHRSLISDLLKSRGWTVLHILDHRKTEEHRFTSAASFINGELTYESPNSPPEGFLL